MSTLIPVIPAVLKDFWMVYNAEDTWLPLYVPMVLWVSAYLYCRFFATKGLPFHKWYALHNFHNFGVILLGQISIHTADNTIFHERIPTLWSMGYFIVDIIDCVTRFDVTYSFHAVCCLFLCITNYVTPVCRELRMTSKAALLEASNPFMHWAKQTRRPVHFLLFAAVYTACRVLWIPVMMYQLIVDGHMSIWNPIFLVLAAFYGLNLFWYGRILRILIQGGTSGTTPQTKATEEDNYSNSQTETTKPKEQ